MPTSGKGSVFIIKQEARIKGDGDKSITSQATSIDLYFEYEPINVEFYVFHKYTNEAGGAQDNCNFVSITNYILNKIKVLNINDFEELINFLKKMLLKLFLIHLLL